MPVSYGASNMGAQNGTMTFNMGTVPSFDDFKFDTVVNVGSAF
jgi:hypothetical protein